MNYLDFIQQINNLLYNLFGLTDITLELQVYINTKRNELNIYDKSEVVTKDKDGEFTQ